MKVSVLNNFLSKFVLEKLFGCIHR